MSVDTDKINIEDLDFKIGYYSYLYNFYEKNFNFNNDDIFFNKALKDGFIKNKFGIESSKHQIKDNSLLQDYELTVEGEEFVEQNEYLNFYKSDFYRILVREYNNIPLETYVKLGSLSNLAKFYHEIPLKEHLENEEWDEIAKDLQKLEFDFNTKNNKWVSIFLDYLIFIIRVNALYKKDEYNSENVSQYNLHLSQYIEANKELFLKAFSIIELATFEKITLLFTEEETFYYFEYNNFSEIRIQIENRIRELKTGKRQNLPKRFLEDDWIDYFIDFKNEMRFDDEGIEFIKADLGLGNFNSTEDNLIIKDFLIKADELISQNLLQEEIEYELSEYIDYINLNSENRRKKSYNDYRNKELLFHRMVDTNIKGKELEKMGKVDRALKLYEENLKNGDIGSHPYNRLAIIYRKRKDYDNEIRVCEKYIKMSRKKWDDNKKEEWFVKRLERAKELKNKN